MGLEVYWTRFAENKLNEIYDYYEAKARPRIARKLVFGIVDSTIRLEKNPYIGQKEDPLVDRPHDFRYLIYKNYKIIYWVDITNKRVYVANVFDCRQNPEKIKEF
ncbi:MAG: type II toxin-antitoxin system RelE/ParE family toxin [Chlorobi bacterium]|nr:type II toxin-antitoxin system RelE/ParE family toxin [Chlorobiota bacterium]